MPRLKRPRVAKLQEVRIAKENEGAIIEFLESGIATTHLTIGPEVAWMTDQEILDLFNGTILAECYQWVPRGHVLRCVVSDAEGEAVIEIDGREFSLVEFSRMLTTFSGWGMRICFVPEDDITEEPEIEVREPEDE